MRIHRIPASVGTLWQRSLAGPTRRGHRNRGQGGSTRDSNQENLNWSVCRIPPGGHSCHRQRVIQVTDSGSRLGSVLYGGDVLAGGGRRRGFRPRRSRRLRNERLGSDCVIAWCRVSAGRWVANVDIQTGSLDPIAPDCGTPPFPTPAPTAEPGRTIGQMKNVDTGALRQLHVGRRRQMVPSDGAPLLPGSERQCQSLVDSARGTCWTCVLGAQTRYVVVLPVCTAPAGITVTSPG